MLIDGAATVQVADRSGEVLHLAGLDTSSVDAGKCVLDFEHAAERHAAGTFREDTGERPSSQDLIGRVLVAHKVFSADDCQNDRQLRYFDQVGRHPYLYVVARLADEAGHAGAEAVAALIRDAKMHNEPLYLGLSIGGSTVTRDGNQLKETIMRSLAVTARECNAACQADVLDEVSKSERHDRVGGWTVLQVADPELPEHLVKALSAGFGGGAPGSLAQGPALAKDDDRQALEEDAAPPKRQAKPPTAVRKPAKRLASPPTAVRKPKTMSRERHAALLSDPPDRPGDKGYTGPKAHPDAAAPFDPTPAPGGWQTPSATEIPIAARKPLTVQGVPVKAAKGHKGFVFDPVAGVLHTPKGSFRAYLPEHDNSQESFDKILNDPAIEKAHNQAMQGWTRAHKMLREHRLPGEVVMHSVLFSNLSPNTPVPTQEYMYSHLVDAMKAHGHDARSPGFQPQPGAPKGSQGPVLDDWHQRGKARQLPQTAPGHFGPTSGARSKATGELNNFMLARNKGANILKYHQMHDQLSQLVQENGADVRTSAGAMLDSKNASKLHEAKRARAVATGKPDPGPYQGIALKGLAPKTARYALGMMGGGNTVVPDTHFVRHFFGLDKKKDKATIEHLKQVLWNAQNHHVLNGMDQWYAQNHPAVQHMLNHPTWGKTFQKPEDAIFPAFWRHWMAIAPHEAARGMKGQAYNELTTHAPYWEAIDPYTKSEPGGMSFLPLRTAMVHQKYAEHYGEVPASLLYATHLLPKLLDEADRRTELARGTTLLQGIHPQLEGAAVTLRQAAEARSWPERPRVFSVATAQDARPVGRYMLMNGNLHHLEDYHGMLSRLIPPGPTDERTTALVGGLRASPHLVVEEDHPPEPSAAPETVPAPPQTSEQADGGDPEPALDPSAPGVYLYRRSGMDRDHVLEVSGDQVYLDGTPLPPGVAHLLLLNARSGASTLRPAGLTKADPPGQGPMDPASALQHIRQAVAAGHLPQEVADSMTHHVYNDKMMSDIPLGNSYAYQEFLKAPRQGVHVALDMNDLREINSAHGHPGGDQALRGFYHSIRDAVDETVGRDKAKTFRPPSHYDAFRHGGDEAQVFLPSYQHAARFVHALRQKMDALPPVGGTHRVSASVGIGHDPHTADQALYHAKAQKLTPGGQRAHAPGQVPMLGHSLYPGHEGPVSLHSEAPPHVPAQPLEPAA